MAFSRQEYWSRLPFPSPGDLPNLRIKPRSPVLQADSLPSEPSGKPFKKEFFRAMKLYCVILHWGMHLTFVKTHRLYNTKNEPYLNYGPWMMTVYQSWFIALIHVPFWCGHWQWGTLQGRSMEGTETLCTFHSVSLWIKTALNNKVYRKKTDRQTWVAGTAQLPHMPIWALPLGERLRQSQVLWIVHAALQIQRQILKDDNYIRNIIWCSLCAESKKNLQMDLFMKQRPTHRHREQITVTRGKGWWEGRVREFRMDMYTLLYLKQIN